MKTNVIVHFSLQRKPAKNVHKVTFKDGARRSLGKLRKTLVHSRYRSDLKQVGNHPSTDSVVVDWKAIRNRVDSLKLISTFSFS